MPVKSTVTPTEKSDSATTTTRKGHVLNTATITDNVEFLASAEDLFDVLTDEAKIGHWTRAPVTFPKEVGKPFSLFNGNVTGTVEKLERPTCIEMKWRSHNFPADHYSHVKIELLQATSFTTLKLHQTGVPVGEQDITRQNWKAYYWNALNMNKL